jgi:hypothetical protein
MMSTYPVIEWEEDGETHSARWRSERDLPPPKRVVIADDTMQADTAFRLTSEGTALLWRGDFQNARQLLNAIARRIDRKPNKPRKIKPRILSPGEAFHLHRQAQSQRARTLGMLLIPLDADYVIPLRRAPDVHLACEDAYGASSEASVVSLREILGLIGAHEWRKKGVPIEALDVHIYPHYGVFSPIRGEYIQLVVDAPLPSVPALACWLRCSQDGASSASSRPTMTRALCCVRKRMSNIWGLTTRSKWCKLIFSPKDVRP